MHAKLLESFIEVVKTGALSRAAERLGVSQPALSLSIKRLEKEVGTSLLHRYKTGVEPTVAGKKFFASSQSLLEQWDELKFSVHQAEIEIEGQFTLGCHPAVALYHLPKCLGEFLVANPKLSLKFVHGLSREINEAIISMKVDIGVVVNPVKHQDLIIIPLHQDEVGFWHHPEYLFDKHEITLLADSNLVQAKSLIRGLEKKGFMISRVIECQTLELLYQLAMQKVGVAILPKTIALSQKVMPLVSFSKSLVYHDEICLVFRHERRRVKAVQALIDCLKSS